MIIGANHDVFPLLAADVPAATGRRIYCARRNLWPKAWPAIRGATDVLSIRPDPADLLAGKLDAAITDLISTAPDGSALTCWHEAGSLPEYVPMPDITPAAITAVHLHVQALCSAAKRQAVTYGAVLCMPPQDMEPWMPAGLDWYGLDFYDEPWFRLRGDASLPLSLLAVHQRLDFWKATVQAITGNPAPELMLCETNSHDPAMRPQWLAAVGEWLAANGGTRMLTFFHPDGPLSGPWLPGDTAVTATLAALASGS